MTSKELIEVLSKFPPDAEVWLEDINFGGQHTEFSNFRVSYDGDVVLIDGDTGQMPCD